MLHIAKETHLNFCLLHMYNVTRYILRNVLAGAKHERFRIKRLETILFSATQQSPARRDQPEGSRLRGQSVRGRRCSRRDS